MTSPIFDKPCRDRIPEYARPVTGCLVFDAPEHFGHAVMVDRSREKKDFFFPFFVFGYDIFHGLMPLREGSSSFL